MPYGRVKDSGLGREGPRYTIEMTEPRLLVINRRDRRGSTLSIFNAERPTPTFKIAKAMSKLETAKSRTLALDQRLNSLPRR